ncbi:hypothetical protein DsansV1_C13g0121271 [Dioscorea sansibarensis]
MFFLYEINNCICSLHNIILGISSMKNKSRGVVLMRCIEFILC